jgi:hypothetical protein
MSDGELAAEVQNRIMVRVGDVDIDLTGSAREIDSLMVKKIQDESWSTALASIRTAREIAIQAARRAAEESGLPERGAAFQTLCQKNNLTRKPDQVLAAIQYLREVEGVHDSPPRVLEQLFLDAGMEPPGNLSLYLNRLRERHFIEYPGGDGNRKNRYAVLTTEGRSHLDNRSRE